MRIYDTNHYELFDPEVHDSLIAIEGAFKTFEQYNTYKLYVNPATVNAAHFPRVSVRLDDLSTSRALRQCKQRELNESWPAEKQAMI